MRRRLTACVLGVLILGSGSAFAQARGDLSGGYRFLRTEGENVGKGWYVDAAGHVNDVLSVVGEVAGSYKGLSETFAGITVDADLKLHTFMGGARFRLPVENQNLVPFGQALFGVGNARASASGIAVDGIPFLDISESSTDGAMSLSGGVDVNGTGRLGFRAMVGWLRDFADEASNAFIFSVGAKVGF